MYGTPDSEQSNKTDNKIELYMGECRDPYPNNHMLNFNNNIQNNDNDKNHNNNN